jgi:hypothetical protein
LVNGGGGGGRGGSGRGRGGRADRGGTLQNDYSIESISSFCDVERAVVAKVPELNKKRRGIVRRQVAGCVTALNPRLHASGEGADVAMMCQASVCRCSGVVWV